MTVGVSALPRGSQLRLLKAVRSQRVFTLAEDPYHEHDFGVVELEGDRYFWKIHYYDLDLNCASPDPMDEAVTTRVLTLMRADEY